MESIKDVEPRMTDFCLCGSGLAFRICCYGKYRSHHSSEIERTLEQGHAAKALSMTREHITWYGLAHTAHTAPAMKTGSKRIAKLLAVGVAKRYARDA